MSSFIKKNPRLAGVFKSSTNEPVPQNVSNRVGTPGLNPSLTGASSLLASTGIPDLDVCLGGGLPPASLLTVFEDFPASKANYTWTAIVRCFLAEGVATAAADWSRKDGGWIAIIGHDISNLLSSLPRPEATSSRSSRNFDSVPTADVKEPNNSNSSETVGNMKIAWRYEGMKEFDSNLKRPLSTLSSSNEKSLGHTFDLNRKLDGIPKQLQETSRALTLNLDLNENKNLSCDYQKTWLFIKESMTANQRSGLGRIVIGSLGAPGLWNCTCKMINNNKSVVCGPAWLSRKISNHIQEQEASHPCLVLITIPTTYLVENLVINLDNINNSNLNNNKSTTLPAWVSAVENVSDAVIELKPLAGLTLKSSSSSSSSATKTENPLTRDYDGFVIIKKGLRRPNSFKTALLETSNLAFKIKRRRFCIEKFHLPPSLEDDNSNSASGNLFCSSSKGAANLSSKSSHPLDF